MSEDLEGGAEDWKRDDSASLHTNGHCGSITIDALEDYGYHASSGSSLVNSDVDGYSRDPSNHPVSRDGFETASISTADETLSFRDTLSAGSVGESSGTGSLNGTTGRAAHRKYLYPLRSKRYDGLRSSLLSPGGISPRLGGLKLGSRSSSAASITSLAYLTGDSNEAKPRDNIKWSKLRRINEQLFSESGRRAFGQPTTLAVSGFIALGTSKGLILIFDYHQSCKHILGHGTKGAITALTISADHTFVAAGHEEGSIFSWEIRRPSNFAKNILPSTTASPTNNSGHLQGTRITHLSFVGTRHSAFVSADSRGMAFYHSFNRKSIISNVESTRIIGRYPSTPGSTPLKPSATYSSSVLPLGTVDHFSDGMGIVAVITPYRLVMVSTTPIPRTQFKFNRPTGAIAESTDVCACATWYPSVKSLAGSPDLGTSPKLAFSWCRQLRVLSIHKSETIAEEETNNATCKIISTIEKEHQSPAPIIAIQWYSSDILCLLTNSAKMQLVDIVDMHIIAQCDLINKHIQHYNLYTNHLRPYFQQREAEYVDQGFADNYSHSFQIYKERTFLLCVNDISIGTVLNYSDRINALTSVGRYVEALETLCTYYEGSGELRALNLPTADSVRKAKLAKIMFETMYAAVKYSFEAENLAARSDASHSQLLTACFDACLLLNDTNYMFERIYELYDRAHRQDLFLGLLGAKVLDCGISRIPPPIMQQLVVHYTTNGLNTRLEEIICLVEPDSLDINQLAILCKSKGLYDALTYVWNEAMHDFITPMIEYMSLIRSVLDATNEMSLNITTAAPDDLQRLGSNTVHAVKVFSYLSMTLTGRVFPRGLRRASEYEALGQVTLYKFLFSGCTVVWPPGSHHRIITGIETPEPTFPYLRLLLHFDCPTFLACMDEAFEDSILNDNASLDRSSTEFRGSSLTRQFIVNILLEVMNVGFDEEDIIYLYMFISRNAPKYPQFILLSGSILQRILIGLCQYKDAEIADDCQLSVEYLLSVFRPVNSPDMLENFRQAGFYRVLKTTFRLERNWTELIKAHLLDTGSEDGVFACIEELLMPASPLNDRQRSSVEDVVLENIVAIASIDGRRAAFIVDQHMPGLHQKVYKALVSREGLLYIYLRELLDTNSSSKVSWATSDIQQKYIELLCIYDREHLVDYLKRLRPDDIECDRIILLLEKYDLIDAIVLLMRAQGKTSDALQRILRQIKVLQLEFMNSIRQQELDTDMCENILGSVNKYAQVGARLCESEARAQAHIVNSRSSSILKNVDKSLTLPEVMWLEFLEALVGLYTQISGEVSIMEKSSYAEARDTRKIRRRAKTKVKSTVQDCFDLLLLNVANRRHLSLITVLTSLLSSPSIKDHSLAGIREILSDIFVTHKYHFQLLAIADSILERGNFQHLLQRNARNKRGWTSQNINCAICLERLCTPQQLLPAYKSRQESLKHQQISRSELRRATVLRNHGLQSHKSAGKKRERSSDESEAFRSGHLEAEELLDLPRGPTIISYACGHLAHESCTKQYLATCDDTSNRVHCTLCEEAENQQESLSVSQADNDHDEEQDRQSANIAFY